MTKVKIQNRPDFELKYTQTLLNLQAESSRNTAYIILI